MMVGKKILSGQLLIPLGTLLVFIQAYRVPVNIIGPGLDQSFPHILNLFAFTSIRYGTDIVYTYGPLGFLLAVENVGHNLVLAFVIWTALYLTLSIAIAYFVVSLSSGWRRISSMILAVLIAAFIDTERLIPCLVMLLLLIAYEKQQHREKILALCSGLLSIGFLIKFPIGIACAGMTIASAAMPIKLRLALKNLFTVVLSMSLTFCSVWFLTCKSLQGIADYFLTSFQIAIGYTAVMSVARSNENASLISFIVALGLLLTMMVFLKDKLRAHTFLVMLFPLFIAWKHGVVRFDGHIIALVSVAMFSAFVLFVMLLNEAGPKKGEAKRINLFGIPFPTRQIKVVGAFLFVCVLLNEGLRSSGIAGTEQSFPLLSRSFMETYGGVKNSWFPGLIPIKNAIKFGKYKNHLDALARDRLAGHRLDKSILELLAEKSVDIYSYELGFIAANSGLNYHPKPIFQHFNAFTDKLDKLNADFFASSKRPEFLIMHHPNSKMTGVDGRHQLYDDPITFLQIMDLYKPVFVERDPLKPQVAILKYSDSNRSRFRFPVAFKNEVVHWNNSVTLPTGTDSSIIRVKTNLQKTFIASVKEMVFRLGPIYLVYILSDGTEHKYRIVPTHLGDSAWITPLFEDYWSFYNFLSGTSWMGAKVVAIRFEADNAQDYHDTFTLVWERIDCKTGYCYPTEYRVFSNSGDGLTRLPIPITSSVLTSYTSSVDSIAAIDVFLSTYAKINKGNLILQVIDEKGSILRESTANAAFINDNAYQLFVFDPISNIKGQKVWLHLMYKPDEHGMVAAWRTSVIERDFDYRIYGH